MNNLKDFFEEFADAESKMDFKMANEIEVGECLSTGSYALDDILYGGWPEGRISQLYGVAGGGKTLLAILAIKAAQAKDPEATQLWIDAEQTLNTAWCEALGVNLSKVAVIENELATSAQKLFELLLGVPREDKTTHFMSGWKKEGFISKIIKKEINCNFIVLDSLGSLQAPAEEATHVGKVFMAPPLAKFLTTTFKKLTPQLAQTRVPMLIINHRKDSMDMYTDHTFSGGNAFRHFLSANVYVEPVTRKDSLILDEREEKIGHIIRATTEKTKRGAWPKKCEFKVNFSKGFVQQHEEIANLALRYDVVGRPTAVTYQFGDRKWVGEGKYQEALASDTSLAQDILNKIYEVRDGASPSQLEIKPSSESSEEDDTKSKRSKKAK